MWLPLDKKLIVDNAVGSTGSQIILVLFASFKITLVHDQPLWLPLVKKKLIVDYAVGSAGRTYSIILSYLFYLCLRFTSMFGYKYSGELKIN